MEKCEPRLDVRGLFLDWSAMVDDKLGFEVLVLGLLLLLDWFCTPINALTLPTGATGATVVTAVTAFTFVFESEVEEDDWEVDGLVECWLNVWLLRVFDEFDCSTDDGLASSCSACTNDTLTWPR